MVTTASTGQSAQAATPQGPTGLNRSCPVCGNSYRERCRRWYVVPEFEVLRCCDCGVTFIDQVIQDNFGFTVEWEIETDPIIEIKSVNDFKRIESKLRELESDKIQHQRLLDVGCGTGAFLRQAQREGWSVAGLELSPKVANYARRVRSLEVEGGSIESPTNFAPASFDIVTMFGVIEHLANPRSAALECARLLRPGGFLVLQTPTEDGLIRRIGRFIYRMTRGSVNFHVRQLYSMGGGHSICFNKRSMQVLLARCGFEVLSIEQSTYGLRVLLMRFEKLPLPKKLIHVVGTTIVFSLGRILGSNNHMTVYAQRQVGGLHLSKSSSER
jgi:SAM-dependent methyltransferase